MENSNNVELSIVLINYNTEHYLLNCIESIFKFTEGVNFEVIVTDNNTDGKMKDTLAEKFPKVVYHPMGYNAGFARANNAGVRASKGDYILLLNDDTLVENNAIGDAFKYLKEVEQKEDVAFLCIQLMNDDRSLQVTTHEDFLTFEEIALTPVSDIVFNRERPKKDSSAYLEKLKENHEAEWVSGAFLMSNKKRYTENDLFLDEDFLIYTEDVEVCQRARKLGLKNLHYSGAAIFHINSASYSVDRKSAQLTISQWLYILKTKGYLSFIKLMINDYLSIFTLWLYTLKNRLKKDFEDAGKEFRKSQIKMMNKYMFKILFSFKRAPSSSKTYLKFIKD